MWDGWEVYLFASMSCQGAWFHEIDFDVNTLLLPICKGERFVMQLIRLLTYILNGE